MCKITIISLNMVQYHMRCKVYYTAEYYRLQEILELFSQNSPHIHRNDTLSVIPFEGGEIFFTFFGCSIFWNIPLQMQAQVIEKIRPCSKNPCKNVEFEEFTLEIEPQCTIPSIDGQTIYAPHKNQKTLLVLSYILGQATRLNGFERTLDSLVRSTQGIPADLAKMGKTKVRNKELVKLLGQTFYLSSSMNLQSDILDTPEMLWEEDNIQLETYDNIRKALEIDKRTHLIDKRLVIIQELCSMLHSNIYHQRSLRLEAAILALIAIETLGFFMPHFT